MRILTLNLHLFAEETISMNQERIAKFIRDYDCDVVLFQEVAQWENSPVYDGKIKVGNYALVIQDLLDDYGCSYDLFYDYGNRAYTNQEEGLAILSKERLLFKKSFYVSRETSYDKYWTRKIIKASIKYNDEIIDIISAHLGWSQGNELFEDQVKNLIGELDYDRTFILGGDFNVSEDSMEYQYLLSKGLNDLYYSGDNEYFHDVTHLPNIDVKTDAKRIDYIFSNKKFLIKKREIVFKDERVSDHYGVYLEIE